ncbi:MAG: DUF5662 family protein [Ruminococcus sp.]|nr:DUF5662 family protein [Ruminococcus sp.]
MQVINHFLTITRHRHEVIKNCFRAGIPLQGLLHDLSKYTPSEFIVGAKYYQGNRSPNEGEREEYGYSKAWIHHKGVNKHHFEHWTDYNPKTKKLEGVEMPTRYVIEMFCDRVAASKIYNGDNYTDATAYNYFDKGRKTRLINKRTSDMIEYLLLMLKEKGKSYTFAYIRRLDKSLPPKCFKYMSDFVDKRHAK